MRAVLGAGCEVELEKAVVFSLGSCWLHVMVRADGVDSRIEHSVSMLPLHLVIDLTLLDVCCWRSFPKLDDMVVLPSLKVTWPTLFASSPMQRLTEWVV